MAAEGPAGWVNILADDFTATVSTRVLLAQADSHLAQLVELELQRNPSSPAVRLDTSASVAAEVVAALRQGSAYVLPGDHRLLAAVKHQMDYLGVQLQPAAGEQNYLVVPTYDLASNAEALRHSHKHGLLMYSSAAHGWANRAGDDDPRPNFLQLSSHVEPADDLTCLASVIRSEYSRVGEDVIYFVYGGVSTIGDAAALKASSMQIVECRPPPAEFAIICDAAMTAAKGHLYMLGGESLVGPWATTLLRKYDPVPRTSFESDPPSNTERLTNCALVSNLREGMLVSIGGYTTSIGDNQNEADRTRPMSDRVAWMDVASGKWTNNPSGCKWPGAALTGPRLAGTVGPKASLSAAAYDEYSIMVVAGVAGQQARVYVLDLRTWRWRDGIAQLQRPGKDSWGVTVVAYEGKVVAVGGQASHRLFDEDDEEDEGQQQQQQQQQQVEEDEQESELTKTGVREVWSYDPVANSWSSDAIARLPFGISRASPVVARVSA